MKIRIGSRGSQLALTQSEMVKDALLRSHPQLEISIIEIKTLGDKKQGTPQAQNGDKKDWILELEHAIIRGDIDIAIHSGKDVPCDLEEGTEVVSLLQRATPFDVFIGQQNSDGSVVQYQDLPQHAVIGTASLRRRAQLLIDRPDLNIIPHRGNVPTRVRKLRENKELSGIIIAAAGIERLGVTDLHYELLKPPLLLPALNQGTLSVQYLINNHTMKELIAPLQDKETEATFIAERQAIAVLEGDCKSAIAAFASCHNNELTLTVRVMTPDGKKHIEQSETAAISDAFSLGNSVGNALLKLGAAAIIEESRSLDF